MIQKKYDIKELPFPVHPGDTVYFVLENGEIEADITDSVGINEDGCLLVICDGTDYEFGLEDRLFLTMEDAEKYINDPDSIPDDYAVLNLRGLNIPFHPGKEYYFCNYDEFMHRWDIFEEYYTYVYFDKNGDIRVGDGESECTIMGEDPDPCFETLRQARHYVRSQK